MFDARKKDDSVASILLFIFNVFLTEKGISEIPLKTILQVFGPFKKSETAVRMGLSRGVQNGLLSNFKKGNEVYYGLTGQATESFQDWWDTIQRFRERIPLQKAGWDGTWNMIFIKSKPEEEFTQSIIRLGYGSLEKNLWLSPFDQSEKVVGLVKKKKLGLHLFQSRLINGEKPEDMAKEIWPIRRLADDYNRYLADLDRASSDLQPNLLKTGEELPILHLFGLRLMEIIKEDPQLPLELLPANWMGVNAAKKFFSVRELILPGARNYIEEVFYHG